MVSPYIKDRFDFGVLRTDGTTKVGLMCVQDKNKAPMWSVFDDEYLANQFFTGAADYGALPAEKELVLLQDDWRSGFGQEMFDTSTPKRYFSSIGMDMRFKGMAIAGPKSVNVTKPTPVLPTLVNGDMEINGTWAGGGQDPAQHHTGSFSWSVGGPLLQNYDATQDLAYTAPVTITVSAWLKAPNVAGAATGHGHLIVDDGVTTIESTAIVEGTDWTQVTVVCPISKASTHCRITLRCSVTDATSAFYVNFDDVTIATVPLGVTYDIVEFNSNLYATFGNYLCKLNGGGTGFDLVDAFISIIFDLEPFTDNCLYITQGFSYAYWYMSTAEAFTMSTEAVTKFQFFKMVNAAVPTMWGNDSAYTIRSSTDPANGGAAWSAQTVIGASYYTITSLLTTSGALYIGKTDMMYYLDSTGAVKNDLAPELQTLTSSTSCQNSFIWLNKVYIPAGSQSLLESDAGVNSWISPALFCTNLSDFNGRVHALAGDDQYLYAILDNSTKIEVLAGREESIAGTTSWVWHPINETTLTNCQMAYVSSIYQKRLWFSSTSSTDNLYYIALPTGYGNITSDANRNFQTGTTMETSWLHANFKNTIKGFTSLTLTMGHTYDADIYFTVKYKKLGDTSWTTIGNYTGSATSMTQSKYIPADAGSNNPKSTMFKLQFTAVTDDVQKTPVLYSYYLTGILYPNQREIIATKVRCANELLLRDGTIDHGSMPAIIATLDEARAASWPITIYDLDGTTTTVKLLSTGSTPRWSVTSRERQGNKMVEEREYNLLMEKVALS